MPTTMLIQNVSAIDMRGIPEKMTHWTDKNLKRLEKSKSKLAFFLQVLNLYIFAGIFVFFMRRSIRSNIRRQKSLFRELGIDREYPMLRLSEQCEALGTEIGVDLLNAMNHVFDKNIKPKRARLRLLETAAKKAKTAGVLEIIRPCRWIENAINEIDDEITEPLSDIRTVLNSLYGPDSLEIKNLNRKIKAALSA
jgi:hypothetical protein